MSCDERCGAVAVGLPASFRQEIDGLHSRIATEGLRLVRADLVHITLKFLGDVPEKDLGSVAAALRGRSRRHHFRYRSRA